MTHLFCHGRQPRAPIPIASKEEQANTSITIQNRRTLFYVIKTEYTSPAEGRIIIRHSLLQKRVDE
jgi:hypothetical protein